jgi:iron(III) transport system substrate-binding protein
MKESFMPKRNAKSKPVSRREFLKTAGIFGLIAVGGSSLSLFTTGCGTGTKTDTTTQSGTTAPTTATAPKTTAASTTTAAKLEDKVVIYSTHGDDMLGVVADAFTKETGVNVDFLNLQGTLQERVSAEINNPQSDVMYGGAQSIFMKLKAQGAFEAFNPTWGSSLDPLFKDSENYFFGTIKTPVILFYNSEVIKPEDLPKDWADLTDVKYAGQLEFRSALSSSAQVMYSALLQQFERKGALDAGWAFMKAMDKNVKQYFDSGTLMMQSIGRKEAGISFSVLNDIEDNIIKNNLPLKIVDLKSGAPIITDSIAVIKNAKHPAAARAFMEFAGSAKIQSVLANQFNRVPTLQAAFKDSPAWMSQVTFVVMDIDWTDLAAKQGEWMQKWDTEIKNSSPKN